jgi:NTP pyrophosphatase (non-canonical NTP hydrolase)
MPDLYEQYAEFCESTAIYPDAGERNSLEGMYLALGLAGEAGEVGNNLKKYYRDSMMTKEKWEASQKELGDVLWYLTNLCTYFDTSIPELMVENMRKLQDRQERGVLGGSGDNR